MDDLRRRATLAGYYDSQYRTLQANGFGGWGGERYSVRLEGWITRLRALADLQLLPPTPASVLELGCGNGMAAYLLGKRGHDVVGVDIASGAISWARDRFSREAIRGEFLVADACDLGCLDGRRFALIVDGNCLHCEFGERRLAFLREARRLLTADGRILISCMVGPPKRIEKGARFDRRKSALVRPGHPPRMLASERRVLRELARTGLRVVNRHRAQNTWWDHLTLLAHGA